MTAEFVVGVDIGTSSCKVALFDEAGAPRGFNRAGYPITRSAAGRAEQNPDDWWQAVCAAVQRALADAGVRGEAIAAIGLSGQIGTHVLIDRDGQPVRPAISWQDSRAQAEVTALTQHFGRARLAEALGVDLPPGAAWPLPRLLWFKEHEPDNLARAWRLLQPKDFVAHMLTGEYATDASSCRGLVRMPGGELVTELLQELGLPLDLPAARRPPAAVMGQVTRAAAAACGVAAGTPVVVGWNDLNCSLVGMGIVKAGQGFDIGGTSEHLGVALAAGARLEPAQALMRVPFLAADPAGAAQVFYGVTSAGGGALEWYASQFVPDLLSSYGLALPADAHLRLAELAASAPPGAGGLVFLPYLNGERAPIWDTAARGVFFGIGSQHRHRHFARSVLEGVAFSLRQILELIEAATGHSVARIVASGGPAGMPVWNQIKASALNRPLMIPQVIHAACLGAAMLAAVGSGWHADVAQAAGGMVHIAEQVDPDADQAARYDSLYPLYTGLYPRLRQAYAELAEFNKMETGRI